MTLLAVSALSVSLGDARVLAEVDLKIETGEIVGLVGPNGAGKTTLLKAIMGLLPLQHGEISFFGRTLAEVGREALARSLAYLPQDGRSHWSVTVETLVTLGRLPHRAPWQSPAAEDLAAVERAMAACDVAQFRDRAVTKLSGGERMRVLLARALAGEPKLLLADEPVAGLDPGHQLDVMQKLQELAASGAGVVVVMHDLTLAARFCSRLALLYDKTIVAEGHPSEVLTPEVLARCYGIRAYHGSADGNAIVVPLRRTPARLDHVAS